MQIDVSRLRRAAAVVMLGAIALTGCSSSPRTEQKAGSNPSAPYYSMLPERVQQAGKLVVATNATFPPIEYFADDNETIIGLDPDLGAALAQQLGVQFDFVNVTKFDAIIPGLVAHRYDIAMTYMSDLKDRYDRVHFVDYFEDQTVLVAKAGNPAGVNTLADLCGKSVVVQKGSFNEINTAEKPSRECVSRGEEPINIVQLPSASDKQTQLESGRADVAITGLPNASFLIMNQPGKFEIVSEPITTDGSHIGVTLPAGETKLRDAIQAAFQAIMDNGEYAKIVAKYGLEAGMVDRAVVNRDGLVK